MTTVFSLLQYHTKLFKLETSYKSPIRNYSSPLDLLFFQNKIIYAHRISKLLNPKLFMLKGASESAKRIDLRFQELRFVRFKKNNALRSSRNRYLLRFALSGAPFIIKQNDLHKKECRKPIFTLDLYFQEFLKLIFTFSIYFRTSSKPQQESFRALSHAFKLDNENSELDDKTLIVKSTEPLG